MDKTVLHQLSLQLVALVTYWNVTLVLGNWAVIYSLRRSLWPFFEKNNGLPGWRAHGWRVKFFLPIGGCVIPSCFVPGPWIDPEALLGEKLALGLMLAAATIGFHHLVRSLGVDELLSLLLGTRRKTKP